MKGTQTKRQRGGGGGGGGEGGGTPSPRSSGQRHRSADFGPRHTLAKSLSRSLARPRLPLFACNTSFTLGSVCSCLNVSGTSLYYLPEQTAVRPMSSGCRDLAPPRPQTKKPPTLCWRWLGGHLCGVEAEGIPGR